MMKTLLILLISLAFFNNLSAQNLNTSEKFKISFLTTELLENYITESDSVLGFDNENYAVDIEIVPLTIESKHFIANKKYSARKLANDLGFKKFIDGDTIPYVKNAFYVLSTDKNNTDIIPVYIMVIVNHDLKIAYEITVYCYNNNSDEGKSIIKSFRILKK